MNLVHITNKECPGCGNPTVVMESCETRRHCNGEAWERREFACGCIVSWVPSFSNYKITTECPRTPEAQAQRKQRNDALQALLKYVAKLNVDESWKSSLIAHLPSPERDPVGSIFS